MPQLSAEAKRKISEQAAERRAKRERLPWAELFLGDTKNRLILRFKDGADYLIALKAGSWRPVNNSPFEELFVDLPADKELLEFIYALIARYNESVRKLNKIASSCEIATLLEPPQQQSTAKARS